MKATLMTIVPGHRHGRHDADHRHASIHLPTATCIARLGLFERSPEFARRTSKSRTRTPRQGKIVDNDPVVPTGIQRKQSVP